MNGQSSGQLPENPFAVRNEYDSARQPNNRNLWLIFGAIAAFCVLCVAGLVALGFSVHRSVYPNADQDKQARSINRDDPAIVVRGMEADPDSVASAEGKVIEERVAEIFKLCAEEEAVTVIDGEGFSLQVSQAVPDPSFTFVESWEIQNSISDYCYPPDAFDNFRIQSIDYLSDSWIVVYLVVWDDQYLESSEELRWWMVKRGDTWMIADHEELSSGFTEAEEYGFLFKHSLDSSVSNYYEFYEQLYDIYEADDSDFALDKLTKKANEAYPQPLVDIVRLHTADMLSYYRKWDRAADFYERISNKTRHPGAYLGLAKCAEAEGDYEDVIRQTDSYLQNVGFSLLCASMRADAFMELDQRDLAITELDGIFSVNAADISTYQQLLKALPKDGGPKLKALIREAEDPKKLAIELCQNVHRYPEYRWLSTLADAIATGEKPSAEATFVRAIQADKIYDYEEAASLYREAMLKASDDEFADRCQRSFMSKMSILRQLPDALESARNKEAAADYVLTDVSHRLAGSTFKQVFEMHEKHAKNKYQAMLTRGVFLQKRRRYDQAIQLFEEISASSSDEDLIASAARRLNKIAIEQGRELERYSETGDDENAFFQFARSLRKKKQWDKLKQILDDCPASVENEQALTALKARLMSESGNVEQATQLQKDFEIRKKSRFAIRSGTWQALLRNAADKEEAFGATIGILKAKQDIKALETAVELATELELSSDSIFRLKLYLAERKDRDGGAELLELYRAHPDNERWHQNGRDGWSRSLRVISKLLEQNDLEAAKALTTKTEAGNLTIASLLIAVYERDVAAMRQQMEDLSKTERLYALWNWPEITRPLESAPEFAELAEVYPLWTDTDVAGTEIYLLFDGENTPNMKALLGRIDNSLKEASPWKQLESDGFIDQPVAAFHRTNGEHRLFAVLMDRADIDINFASKAERVNFQYCLSLLTTGDSIAPRQQLQKIALAAVEDSCIAVIDDKNRMVLRPHEYLAQHFANTKSTKAARVTISSKDDYVPYWRQMKALLPKVIELREDPSRSARVKVNFNAGPLRETVWAKMVDVHGDALDPYIVCEFESSSPLSRRVRMGKRAIFSPHSVMCSDASPE